VRRPTGLHLPVRLLQIPPVVFRRTEIRGLVGRPRVVMGPVVSGSVKVVVKVVAKVVLVVVVRVLSSVGTLEVLSPVGRESRVCSSTTSLVVVLGLTVAVLVTAHVMDPVSVPLSQT